MKFPRSAGILLHPTSLPSAHGIGDLGPDAHRFAEWLASAGLKIWQMLPLGPTGYGDSPYQCFSAFAGNPLLVHLPGTVVANDSAGSGTRGIGARESARVDFAAVIAAKRQLLADAFRRFTPDGQYEEWRRQQSAWLDDYALFSAIKSAHGGASWTEWPRPLADRDPAALAAFRTAHAAALRQVEWEQYAFFTQFAALRRACAARGIRLMGDVPIYVAHDSADVWANRTLFQLNADGSLRVQAGVPPDYFSETGQLWGNPLYDWSALRSTRYRWWIARMRAAFTMFDIVRLDHFRGFAAYWEVDGRADTAIDGRWVPGPGAELFRVLTDALGPMPIVAENLGLITPDVEALRESLGFPGMSILQFAFGGEDSGREFRPHTFTRERVVYTGSHDNDTTVGWWESKPGPESTRTAADIVSERAYARRYLGTDGKEIHWTLIRAAMSSVADTALVPMQDILGLGSDARMNLPGRNSGNWSWRFEWSHLEPATAARLREMVLLYDR